MRKRLGQYYSEGAHETDVRIELPVGSYIPKFHRRMSSPSGVLPPKIPPIEPEAAKRKFPWWRIEVAAAALATIVIAKATLTHKHVQPKSAFSQFWAPVFATRQPVLVCISSPVIYAPTLDVLKKGAMAHPGLYDSQLQWTMNPLELDPNTPLKWKDIAPLPDEFVGKAHVYTVASLAILFDRIHKPIQIKVGSDFFFNYLQNSPAVLLGAFDNPWSVRMAAELPFPFREQDGVIAEREARAASGVQERDPPTPRTSRWLHGS